MPMDEAFLNVEIDTSLARNLILTRVAWCRNLETVTLSGAMKIATAFLYPDWLIPPSRRTPPDVERPAMNMTLACQCAKAARSATAQNACPARFRELLRRRRENGTSLGEFKGMRTTVGEAGKSSPKSKKAATVRWLSISSGGPSAISGFSRKFSSCPISGR